MKIPKSESKTVEFKTAFNQDVIVSLVAFANADGGDVYVGVRDDGKVVGVQLAAESETTWVNEIKSKTGAAVGGSEFARSGYRFMYGNADDWSMIESIHREQIQHRMDKDQAGQEEIEDALFTSGGIIGSSSFVEELTMRERVAFPRERKSSPQEVCVGGLKLFALRHLKAFRK